MASGPVSTVFTEVFAVELELEAPDCLFTVRVVTYDLDFGLFAYVVLVSIKNDFRGAFLAPDA